MRAIYMTKARVMNTDNLDKKRRLALVGAAHHLKPVVMIGHKGLTSNVIAETDQALTAHELIKVRISVEEKDERQAVMEELCNSLQAIPLNLIGNVAIIYRKNPE